MRKLRLAAAVGLVLASTGAFALGLGDIEMRSALNQPMNAEIRLTSVKPGELDGMIVTLASPEAFARAGIERSQSLQDLRFSVDQSGSEPVIRITSSGPVVEPFLNFLLEVDWPQGRMVREYTVLLDPPVFLAPSTASSGSVGDTPARTDRNDNALVAPAPIEREVAADSNAAVAESFSVETIGNTDELIGDGEVVSLDEISAPVDDLLPADVGEVVSLTDLNAPNSAAEEARAEAQANARAAAEFEFDVEVVGGSEEVSNDFAVTADEPASTPSDEGEFVSLESLETIGASDSASSSGASTSGERTVQQGDTLFEIAQDLAPSGVTVQQMMLALLSANESAFIDGNINLVRAGSILRVPTSAEATALTQSQAVAEVANQSQLWQEYRDNLRGNQGTQLAANSAQQQAPVEEPVAEDAVTDSDAVETVSTDAEESAESDVLSADARAILEQARQEILQRDELRIVGEDSSSSDIATAGEGRDGTDGAALSSVDRRLQLAREELSSRRLEAQDLDDQASELRSTTDNLDALVALRQNEIAALEQSLADARTAADEAEAGVVDGATGIVDGATGIVDEAADAAGSAISDATEAGADAVAAAGDTLAGAGDAASDAVGNALDNATAASTDAAADATAAVSQPDEPWFKTLLSDPRKLAVAGVGGLALLGVLGTLLWRRRKSDDRLADLDDDQVQFLDGDGADFDATDATGSAVGALADKVGAGGAAVAAAGAAGAAGVAGAASDFLGSDDEDDGIKSFDDTLAAAAADDELDGDDTISEVEVYLAYGLHGQAEELLTGAIAQEPENPVYVRKLLDTYHAQENSDAFAATAKDFHARFGGDNSPNWNEISAMGHNLRPQDPLFSGSADAVASVGAGGFGGDSLGAEDFSGLDDGTEAASSSVSRDFGSADEAMDFSDGEAGLMDQSLDPAFAFDEGDLEATGDFSQIANDLADETDDGVIEFPSFDEPVSNAADKVKAAAASTMDGIDAPGLDSMDLSSNATAANEQITAADGNDMTLDLDELTGGLSIDDTDLGTVDALEIPDLTADNDLLSDTNFDATAVAGEADEMDTMMDLAKAYIDMGDKDSASNALGEIVKSGRPDQVTEAETLLRKIS